MLRISEAVQAFSFLALPVGTQGAGLAVIASHPLEERRELGDKPNREPPDLPSAA